MDFRRVDIRPADLDDVELARFLEAHKRDIAPTAPPESQHALDQHSTCMTLHLPSR